ncbi:MAG: hypothetical protein JRG96_01630 [Deltaproteobacteria bacterium]|nr:hypothetical protein [Deltaproteobacteria bacterium]MBW2418827.1 hypothetical protein [Deltaproteobacteria bacterium]
MAAIAIALSAALPAWSASVVEVRVGRHAEFTRVVFELDAPAGYSLQRHAPAPGISELVVSLDAGATAQEIKTGKAMITGVEISPRNSKRSVAHIRLTQDGLRVKEMILASPPRIVLDVLGPAKPKAAVTPASSKPKPVEPSVPVATATPAVVPDTSKPKPAPVARSPKVVEKPAAKATQPAPETSKPTDQVIPPPVAPVDVTKPALAEDPATPQKLAIAKPPAEPPATSGAVPPSPDTTTPLAMAKPRAKVPPPPREKRVAPKPVPARKVPAPAPVEESAFDMKIVGGGLAAVAVVGLLVFAVLRRRASYEVMDGDEFDVDPLAADNPFAELGDDLAVGGDAAQESSESALAGEPLGDFGAEASSGLQEDLFGAAPAEADKGEVPKESVAAGETMDSLSEMPTTPIMDGVGAMVGAGAAGEDVMGMLRAFEQRIASLESRLDEASEAKERLERQVAAQTEELRVQRAAIARTQRAVRNLNRPEDEAPTEPALRDPSRPDGPRTDV